MQLQDPHFVAQRCDLDSSGDLDAHELKPLGDGCSPAEGEEGVRRLF